MIPCAALLLKVIIEAAHVDTRATLTNIRLNLSSLDKKMVELSSNVKTFNTYVKNQRRALPARGATSENLLVNLFKGYESVDDADFQDFIKHKRATYEEGGTLTVDDFLATALNKNTTRVMQNLWNAPTKEQEQILALTAQLAVIKKKTRGSTPPNPKALSNAQKKMKKAADDKKRQKRQDADTKWAWKRIMPAEGEPRVKLVGAKTYNCNCKFHPAQWVEHTQDNCKLNPNSPTTNDSPSKESKRRIKAARVAAALLEDDDSDDTTDNE